jgi:hypothetical protein
MVDVARIAFWYTSSRVDAVNALVADLDWNIQENDARAYVDSAVDRKDVWGGPVAYECKLASLTWG